MKEKIKQFRLNITVPALFTLVIGVLLLLFPTESLSAISKGIAVIIILCGIFIAIRIIQASNQTGLTK